MRRSLSPVVLFFALALAPSAALAGSVTVPVDIGVGPAIYLIGAPCTGSLPAGGQCSNKFYQGPVWDDQKLHYGLKIDIEAVIDQETIRKNRNRIPKQYQDMASRMTEVRFKPSIFIPDSLFISPGYKNTGIYGVTWEPVSLGIPIGSGESGRLSLDAGVLLTAAYIHSSVFDSPTIFVRPGLDLRLSVEIAFSKSFLISFGWMSQFYIPQVVGHFLDVTPVDRAIWHIGQAFLQFHFRFPYEVKM